jgi:hypothetical protein
MTMACKVWTAMNDLSMVTTKICSAREIIEAAVLALEAHQTDKAETLMEAANEFLAYYLEEFDKKFDIAWKATVVPETNLEEHSESYYDYDRNKPISSQYTDEELDGMCDAAEFESDMDTLSKFMDKKKIYESPDKGDTIYEREAGEIDRKNLVRSWHIDVEDAYNKDGETIFSYIQFPDNLIEHMGVQEGSKISWTVNPDGTVIIKKI